MQFEFTAFADDSIFTGNLVLRADRLSDVVADDAEFQVRDVEIVALDSGERLSTHSAMISRGDFAAISGAGPRGNPAHRFPTRQHPIQTQIGPYHVLGYLHAPPSAHIVSGAVRRRVVPLTLATIRYRMGASEIKRSFEVLLLNGDRVRWVEPASRTELAMSAMLELPTNPGRRNDLSGNFSH
jgi:hypothetical protein